jgi:hypothetical protein
MNMMIGAIEIEKREQRLNTRGFGRNILIALTAATLAGIIAFQAIGPATFDGSPTVTDRSAEVFDGSEDLISSAPSGSAGLIE